VVVVVVVVVSTNPSWHALDMPKAKTRVISPNKEI